MQVGDDLGTVFFPKNCCTNTSTIWWVRLCENRGEMHHYWRKLGCYCIKLKKFQCFWGWYKSTHICWAWRVLLRQITFWVSKIRMYSSCWRRPRQFSAVFPGMCYWYDVCYWYWHDSMVKYLSWLEHFSKVCCCVQTVIDWHLSPGLVWIMLHSFRQKKHF